VLAGEALHPEDMLDLLSEGGMIARTSG